MHLVLMHIRACHVILACWNVSRRAIAAGAGSPAPVEESPDCTERGVLSIRKDAADDMPRKDQCNREQTAVTVTVRVKGWGKSPPEGGREPLR